MHKLKARHPNVFKEFSAGNHSISRSQQPFAQVWTDIALKQSIDLDSKSKGGIVGISRREDAGERCFLTSHARAAITHSLKETCRLENYEQVGTAHKEAGAARMKRDQEDIDRQGSDTREDTQIHCKLISAMIPRQFRNSTGSTSQTLETKKTWQISCVVLSVDASHKA